MILYITLDMILLMIFYGWCYLADRPSAKLFAICRSRAAKLNAKCRTVSRSNIHFDKIEQICVLGHNRALNQILIWWFQCDFPQILRFPREKWRRDVIRCLVEKCNKFFLTLRLSFFWCQLREWELTWICCTVAWSCFQRSCGEDAMMIGTVETWRPS